MGKQNYPSGRNGVPRKTFSGSEERSLVKRNNGRFRRSATEIIASIWPLSFLPALLMTLCLWHLLAVQEGFLWRLSICAGIATAYLLNSLLTIWFYKVDKRLAEQQLRRIPEFSLHFWELFCGWPGALYAQKKYHHKWKKTSYMVVFWLYVVLNVTVILGVAFPEISLPVLRNVNDALKSLSGRG